jgi:hypothetical protein
MSGAKAVLFHPASRAWSLQLLLLPAFSFWPSAVFCICLELAAFSFQLFFQAALLDIFQSTHPVNNLIE